MDRLEQRGCPKSKTMMGPECASALLDDNGANEFLLADPSEPQTSNACTTYSQTSPADYELQSNTKESSRRSSVVEECSDCDFK